MHLSPDVHIEWVEGEAVALDAETGALHYLNSAAALALALIAEKGVEAAAAELKSKHSEDPALAESEFTDLINDFVERRLLIE